MFKCKSVKTWLDQFPAAERPLAVLTLEHLKFVTTDEVKQDLSVMLGDFVDKLVRANSKILIESILSKEDVERYLLTRGSDVGTEHLSASQTSQVNPNLFPLFPVSQESQQNIAGLLVEPLSRRSQPTRCLYGHYFPSEVRDEESGSEKYLDLVIRKENRRLSAAFKAAKKNSPIVQGRTEIQALSGCAVPVELVLITDNIGSGAQIIDFLSSALLGRTLGPLSTCQISITVLAWTATQQGISAIEQWTKQTPFGIDLEDSPRTPLAIHYLRTTESFLNLEDAILRDQILTFFKKYGDPEGKKSTEGLGFGMTASRTVMLGSSCPNNVPDFLYTSVTEPFNYDAIFNLQALPDDLIDYFLTEWSPKASAKNNEVSFLQEMKDLQLIQAARRPATGGGDVMWRILLCTVASYDRWAAIRSLQVSSHKFRQAETALIQLGWITPQFMATEAGTKIVKDFGMKGSYYDFASARRYLKRQVDARLFTYYPQSVRGVR